MKKIKKRDQRSVPAVAFYGKVRIPTIGHKKAVDHASDLAKQHGGRLYIGLSGTSHPLSPKSKRAHAEAVFGHPVMPESKHTSNVFHFLSHLNSRHDHLHLVAGSDRAAEYKKILRKYNGKKDKSGNVPFNFKSWKVHEVPGRRINSRIDPRKMSQKEKEQSVSASRLESLAHEGQYEQFKAYHPGLPDKHVRRVYNEIRSAGRIDEGVTRKDFGPLLTSFIDFASDNLGIKSIPNVRYKGDGDNFTSFGAYNPDKKEIAIHTKDRHPMDVFRTIAHELVHHKQNEDGKLKDVEKEGATGSDVENDANKTAGIIMRHYAKSNPKMFDMASLEEGKQAIFVVGGPCSGKDKIVKLLKEQAWLPEVDLASISQKVPQEQRMIVNGSATNLNQISSANQKLKDLNYKTSMIFVNVENNISKMRNEQRVERGQRTITESVRFEKFTQATNNIEEFKKIFGENMKIVDNSINEEVKKPTGKLKKACWKGYTAVGMKMKGDRKVPNCVPVKEDKGPCWSGYEMIGMKKKGAKKVPNCVPVKETIDDRFTSTFTEDCGYSHKKKKVVRKKLNQEGLLDNAAGNVGLSVNGDGLGPEFAISKVPGLTSGIGTAYASPGLGFMYPPFGTLAESIQKWVLKEETQLKFIKKYGSDGPKKLLETALKLNEGIYGMPDESGTVPGNRYKEQFSRDAIEEGSPAWQRKEGKNPEGGLNKKGVASYRREHPGSKLSTAVTTKPSKLKPGSKAANRRKSFCARMSGMKKRLTSAKTANDPNSRINKSLRKWNCEE